MAYGPLGDLLRHIRSVALTAEAGDVDDAGLFEVLVRRHGPMVLGVCRRLLRDPHATEDAFQATFLVLLRKANTLRKRELLANWLYGVAYRTALKARTQAVRRSAHARPLIDMPAGESESDLVWKDLRPVLDEEVERLPAKYRMPVVLCYLEGKSFEEAARQLGWPAGTVSGRLARARQLLRTRLTRRGLGLSGGLLAMALSRTASATVPSQLRIATIRAALTLAAQHAETAGVLSTSVLTLMEGVLHAMFLTKVKILATGLLIAAVISGGAGVVTYQKLAAQSADQPEAIAAKAVAPTQRESREEEALDKEAGVKALVTSRDKLKAILDASNFGEKMKSLLQARLDAGTIEIKARYVEYCNGRGTLDIFLGASRRVLDAERDLSMKKADQITAWESHLHRMQQVYLINLDRYNAARISLQDLKQAEYYRIDAEIGLERAKEELKKDRQAS
jgi:RNA polymerase sigma factor (sigma-70 family)